MKERVFRPGDNKFNITIFLENATPENSANNFCLGS